MPPYVKTFSLAFIGLAVYSEIITDSQVSQRKRGGMSMLTLLNSESLWIGTDMKLFNKLREQLEQVGITYKHKVKNRMGQWAEAGTMRGRTGSAGIPADETYEYEILVHKNELEHAKKITGLM